MEKDKLPDLHQQVLSNLPDGITVQNKDFNIIYQNKVMKEAFGDCVGKKCYASYEKRDEICEGCGVLKSFQTGEPTIVLRTAIEQDGTTLYCENGCFPLFDEAGDIVAGVEICRNITGRVSLEEEIKGRNIELGQLNKKLKRQARRLESMLKELRETQARLVEASRRAGMAEVATGVLHNVGNVLNSVNVAAELVKDTVRKSEMKGLSRVVELVERNKDDLGRFLAEDTKGSKIPLYLKELASVFKKEQRTVLEKATNLVDKVEKIKTIISLQQSYAKTGGVSEICNLHEIVNDAIEINSEALKRHLVTVKRDFAKLPVVVVDKQKIMQIIVNLISNAKYAVSNGSQSSRLIIVQIEKHLADWIRISVVDNGVGIPAENIERIFNHGFTTRKDGHGFGLHSAGNVAHELGGTLTAHSDGPGKGATFVLELPVKFKSDVHG